MHGPLHGPQLTSHSSFLKLSSISAFRNLNPSYLLLKNLIQRSGCYVSQKTCHRKRGDHSRTPALLNRYFIADNSDHDRIDEVCYAKDFKCEGFKGLLNVPTNRSNRNIHVTWLKLPIWVLIRFSDF